MARKDQFSVTLPQQAIEMLEELVSLGLHGKTRAEVARKLILDRLEDMIGRGIVSKAVRK
jgi:Arc/MetJ-type ribon-helix-helix transcriptional regulator